MALQPTVNVQKLSEQATLVPSHQCRFILHALILSIAAVVAVHASADEKYVASTTPIAYFGFRSSTNGLPACTTSFGLTKTFSTTHPVISSSDLTGISSFIASRIVTTFSFSILSPSLISTFQTLALRGASIGVMSGSSSSQQCNQD
jgi:hypothetical protein